MLQAALVPQSRKRLDKESSELEEKRVIRTLWTIVRSTFRRFRVKKSVVFAFDGVPPLAKLAISQQRRQRAARVGLLSARIELSLRANEGHVDETASIVPVEGSKEGQEDGGGIAHKSTQSQPESETNETTDLRRSGYGIRKE